MALTVALPSGLCREGRVPRLLGIRGEYVVHPSRDARMGVRVGQWSGARWEHAQETLSNLQFQLYAGVPFDLCLALRRVLLRPPFGISLTFGSPEAVNLEHMLPWWRVQLEFAGIGTVRLLAGLGRSTPSVNRTASQYLLDRLVLSNRPTAMRYVQDTMLLFSLRRDRYLIRPHHWNGKGWAPVGAMDLPRETGIPPSTIKFQGGDHSVTLRTDLKGFSVQERRGLGGAWSFVPMDHMGAPETSKPVPQLVRYKPDGPPERMLLLYWVNALGGWETSLLEWTEWLGRGAEEGQVWDALWRAQTDGLYSVPRHGVRLEAGLETVVRGRIFAPDPAERVWLGELLGSPLVYVGNGGNALAPARVVHGEQAMVGEGIWVEVELSVGVVNGHAAYLYRHRDDFSGLPS